MNKIGIIGIMISLFMNNVFGDNLNEYQTIKVRIIQSGFSDGMIGWEKPDAGGGYGPLTFVISKNNQIYVPDRVNQRINIYDLNGNYLRTIDEEKPAHFSNTLRVDLNGNVIGVSYYGLRKIDPNGKGIFTINSKALPKSVINSHDFFALNDDVFIYNDRDLIQYIDKNGSIRSTKEAVKRLMEITSNTANAQFITKSLSVISRKTIESLQANPNYLIVGGRFYSADFFKAQAFFDKVKNVRLEVQSKTVKKSSIISVNLKDFSLYHLIDYDSEHNSYWLASSGNHKNEMLSVFVYSELGELLDAFYYGQYMDGNPNREAYPLTGALTAIAPSGDVYFLIGNEDEYTFYKVQRQW